MFAEAGLLFLVIAGCLIAGVLIVPFLYCVKFAVFTPVAYISREGADGRNFFRFFGDEFKALWV